ncbi:cellulase family glycosylhydrolase [Telmatobacter sp. DSM 110680]|uniref:Cellulase family glycosylhydrolase n=1 Tax=Telmatobacter sp. DSM 110680 TaxID=3036704 RepID=A0AAU7DJ32_9BACT
MKIAFARAQHLRHGINASEWFAQTSNYSAEQTNKYTDDSDIALMAQLGFDNVRLSIDAAPLTRSLFGRDVDFMTRLDHAVDQMIAKGMAVQIDIHPESDYKKRVSSSSEGVDRFVMLWRKLATHYSDRNPDLIFFEIMNEPEERDPYRWAGVQARAAEAIREAAPRNTIIATGPNWSSIADLLTQEPLPDGNVIYNFHFYEPHEFTHQGAGWGGTWWIYTHDIPYPADESSMQDSLKQLPDASSRYAMEHYWLDHWDAHRIRLQIDAAAAWGKDRKVPLICNEFGAYREHTKSAARMNWIRDVRTALEADGIGWTMWDYRGGFGVVWKQDGQPAKVDSAVVEALGLKK